LIELQFNSLDAVQVEQYALPLVGYIFVNLQKLHVSEASPTELQVLQDESKQAIQTPEDSEKPGQQDVQTPLLQ
jgi:hypothetical protein